MSFAGYWVSSGASARIAEDMVDNLKEPQAK